MLKPTLIWQLIKTTKWARCGIPGQLLSRLDLTAAGSCLEIPKTTTQKEQTAARSFVSATILLLTLST